MITVLTKTDALRVPALNQYMRENGLTIKEAMSSAGEMAAQMLRRLREKIESQLSGCKHPPKAYLEMAYMELQKLVISTQQVNISLNIEYAVKG